MAERKVTVYLTDIGAKKFQKVFSKKRGGSDFVMSWPVEHFKKLTELIPENKTDFKAIATRLGFSSKEASKCIEKIEVGGLAKFNPQTRSIQEI